MELCGVNTFAQGMQKGEEKGFSRMTGRWPRWDRMRPMANPRRSQSVWFDRTLARGHDRTRP
jgi:hypothetical protein